MSWPEAFVLAICILVGGGIVAMGIWGRIVKNALSGIEDAMEHLENRDNK